MELKVPVVIDNECIKKEAEEIKRDYISRFVLEDIRAEIEAYEKELLLSKRDEDVVAELAVNHCLEIIDKHLKGESDGE